MEQSDQTPDEHRFISTDVIAQQLHTMDLSNSGIQETIQSFGERDARAIKQAAVDIAWHIVLPAEGSHRAAAEQAALAAILVLKREHQILTIRTIVGPKDIPAPANFEFDKTATMAWIRLLDLTRAAGQPMKLKRDLHVIEGQIDVLALVLSNALGYTKFFWEKTAREFAQST